MMIGTFKGGIHPKEYQKAVNRGYNMTQKELEDLKAFMDSSKE